MEKRPASVHLHRNKNNFSCVVYRNSRWCSSRLKCKQYTKRPIYCILIFMAWRNLYPATFQSEPLNMTSVKAFSSIPLASFADFDQLDMICLGQVNEGNNLNPIYYQSFLFNLSISRNKGSCCCRR